MAGWVQDAESGDFLAAPLVPQTVAGGAERHKVFRLVVSTLAARFDVMHLEEPGAPTARGLATVFVPCQNFSANARRDCGCVPATVFANRGIAAHSFGLGFAEFAFA